MRNRNRKVWIVICLLLVEISAILSTTGQIQSRLAWQSIEDNHEVINEEFRQMKWDTSWLKDILASDTEGQSRQIENRVEESFYQMRKADWVKGIPFFDCFACQSKSGYLHDKKRLLMSRQEKIMSLVLTDLRLFPVPKDGSKNAEISFENSWGSPRSYGGDRRHEGVDIMASNNQRGYFPVISMSEGVVEQRGWLEQGGYRIGIRTKSGLYIYYAHLCQYAPKTDVGMLVKTGQILGTMGDTGYSKVEGTTGNFAVHLHIGFYYNEGKEEISVNPYYILKAMESRRTTFWIKN